MKNIRNVIAALTAEQKENDYELVESLQEELAGLDIAEIADLYYGEISDKLDRSGFFDLLTYREKHNRPSDLNKWAESHDSHKRHVTEAGLIFEKLKIEQATTDEILNFAYESYHKQCCHEQLEELECAIHSVISDFLNPKKSAIA